MPGLIFTSPGLIDDETSEFIVNPTLSPGDVTFLLDGVSQGNLSTLPTAEGVDSTLLVITLTTGENVEGGSLVFEDPATLWTGPTWYYPFGVDQNVYTGTPIIYPITSSVSPRVDGDTLNAYIGETVTFRIYPINAAGDPVDTTGTPLEVVIEKRDRTDVETITDASITKDPTWYEFTTSTANLTTDQKTWSTRIVADDNVIGRGPYLVTYAAEVGP